MEITYHLLLRGYLKSRQSPEHLANLVNSLPVAALKAIVLSTAAENSLSFDFVVDSVLTFVNEDQAEAFLSDEVYFFETHESPIEFLNEALKLSKVAKGETNDKRIQRLRGLHQ